MRCSSDLDDDQRRAVTTESQLVAVVAGAGSGKTRVLTRRAAYRVATGTADEAAHARPDVHPRGGGRAPAPAAPARPRRDGSPPERSTRSPTACCSSDGATSTSVRNRSLPDRRRIDRPDRAPRRRCRRCSSDEIGWATARGLTPAAYESAVRRGERRPSIDPRRSSPRRSTPTAATSTLTGSSTSTTCSALTIDAIEHDADYADAQRWRFRHLLVDEAQDLNPLQHRLARSAPRRA